MAKEIDMGGDIVVINGKVYSKTKLCTEWFHMSNDLFFKVYGFNFNPHNYPGLYGTVRRTEEKKLQKKLQEELQREMIGGPLWNMRR